MDVKLFKCEFFLADAFIVIDQQPPLNTTSGGVPKYATSPHGAYFGNAILRILLIVKVYEIFFKVFFMIPSGQVLRAKWSLLCRHFRERG
jgi:hypothetical protein